jgi:hypothetical protein
MKMQVFKSYIDAVIFSAIMICMITLGFLLAMAARFGYGSNGSDVMYCVLTGTVCLINMIYYARFRMVMVYSVAMNER